MTPGSSNQHGEHRPTGPDIDPAGDSLPPPFACQSELLELLELLVNVMFCMKGVDGRYLAVNGAFVRRTGRSSKREVIGRLARELFSPELAERYEQQDREVFDTAEPLRDELELIRREDGRLGWYLTTKLPVSDDRNRVQGLVSISRDLKTPKDGGEDLESVTAVVRHVQDHLARSIRLAELARAAGCSEYQLDRRMRKVFGLSPTQYVLRARVDQATRLLADTDRPLAQVAVECGFYDQADFTRRFARLTNETPAQFRATHRGRVRNG